MGPGRPGAAGAVVRAGWLAWQALVLGAQEDRSGLRNQSWLSLDEVNYSMS